MRIHTIIHAPFEKAGVIESWAVSHGHDLSSTHTYKGEKLPEVSTIDFLVIMGGPQSPIELEKYPYLRNEILLTKQTIDQKKAVLGICLGAQIIAESLGAKTERSPNKEIGVYPIKLTDEALIDPIFKLFPKSFDVMHWHNDMPGIPHGGVLLASSAGCPRQAFKYGDRVYGLQCHMEMTMDLVKGMVEHCANDLNPGKYVQDSKILLTQDLSEINKKMIVILDQLAALIVKNQETIRIA
ncbi:MAG TPA: GMP synthase [Gammaproteobacteria bacterium]|jgi:GMP synthase (glutamine-hydrolysing)|nr:GMP synthase [Gammaproteobacteria bacterium]